MQMHFKLKLNVISIKFKVSVFKHPPPPHTHTILKRKAFNVVWMSSAHDAYTRAFNLRLY